MRHYPGKPPLSQLSFGTHDQTAIDGQTSNLGVTSIEQPCPASIRVGAERVPPRSRTPLKQTFGISTTSPIRFGDQPRDEGGAESVAAPVAELGGQRSIGDKACPTITWPLPSSPKANSDRLARCPGGSRVGGERDCGRRRRAEGANYDTFAPGMCHREFPSRS